MIHIILIVFGVIFAVSLAIILYEIKNAPLVGDDYEYINPSDAYRKSFCDYCLKNIDGIYCNNGVHLRKINDEMINICKKESYFEPK
jgi:hypothetical protein